LNPHPKLSGPPSKTNLFGLKTKGFEKFYRKVEEKKETKDETKTTEEEKVAAVSTLW
jgi:hypothetical protein